MWCLNSCSVSGKKWTQIIKGKRQADHTQAEPGLSKKSEQFSYSTVPLYAQHRRFGLGVGRHGSSAAKPPIIIRLLRILPTKSDGLLSCSIRVVELDGAKTPSYDALSYTWGPTTRDEIKNGMNAKRHHVINCGDWRLLVTENLLNCLTQLEKDGYYHRDIWIDAICVNQDDHAERCQQVSIMADIYRSAERVIVWLGAADGFTQPAWQLIEGLSQLSKEDLLAINPQAFDNKQNDDLLGHANSSEHWRALALLFGRSWFTRAWVIQELVLARDTTVLCGNYTFNWESMVSVSHFMATRTSTNTFKAHLFDDLHASSLSYKNPAKLAAVKRSTLAGTSDVLLHSLIRCRTYEASNDHDKVYSLLGLANCQSYDHPGLYPNYESAVTQLYTDVAKYILDGSDDLHLLAHAEGDDFRHTPKLPTWVPDWSVKKDLGLRITGYVRYEAAGTLSRFMEFRNENALVVRGFEFDTITRIGETKAEVNSSKVCTDWLGFLSELEQEYPDRDYRDAFWRTLLIDTDPSGTVPIRKPWENSFDIWMNHCAHEPSEKEKQRADEFETSFTHSLNLRIFRTARGHLGCGTLSCRDGDSIWIVQGSRVPLILRPAQKADSQAYHLVGGTYLHGFMQGEALLNGSEFSEVTLI
ncbi:HET-domain-containing protein [Hypoxylon crocopeplum]|nr:HET-domain-containing protein [Hypoxylon crocopeplum]